MTTWEQDNRDIIEGGEVNPETLDAIRIAELEAEREAAHEAYVNWREEAQMQEAYARDLEAEKAELVHHAAALGRNLAGVMKERDGYKAALQEIAENKHVLVELTGDCPVAFRMRDIAAAALDAGAPAEGRG